MTNHKADENNLYIGLMSGTSMDGVNAALVSFDDINHKITLIASHLEEIPKTLRETSLDISLGNTQADFRQVAILDPQFGYLFAQCTNNLLQKAQVPKHRITAIGSHGQTLWHHPHPPQPFTIQLGDPNVIAKLTGLTTIADFRRGDLALNGQGAPFVPPFHQWLFGAKDHTRIILNIGGMANITLLPQENDVCLGFDTGPGNGLMDAWIWEHRQQRYDHHGAFAKEGQQHPDLLQAFLSDPYFSKAPPKSTGKDYFNLTWVKKHLSTLPSIAPQDVQATLLDLTAKTIAQAILQKQRKAQVFVCGGGSFNPLLMAAIQRYLGSDFQIQSTENVGVPPEWMEAMCFAWYAKQRMEYKPVDLRSITGAIKPTLLGGIYAP